MESERKKQIIRLAGIILMSAVSFALGFLFANQTAIAPIVIEKCSEV